MLIIIMMTTSKKILLVTKYIDRKEQNSGKQSMYVTTASILVSVTAFKSYSNRCNHTIVILDEKMKSNAHCSRTMFNKQFINQIYWTNNQIYFSTKNKARYHEIFI